jgi:hypothetical protein
VDDELPPYLWQAGTTELSASFHGIPGHTYRFYTRARDHAGNVEAAPGSPGYDVQVVAGMECVYAPLMLRSQR